MRTRRRAIHEPTGKKVEISGLSAAIYQNVKVVQHWEFSDDASLLRQLDSQLG